MNLADVYLKSAVFSSSLEMRQTLFDRGLYDLPGASVNSYKEIDLVQNIARWTFNDQTGIMKDSNDTDNSIKSKDDYWVPVHSKSFIDEDRMVLVIEGTSLKPNLPEIRTGSTIPFSFQINDFDLEINGLIVRQLTNVVLTFADDTNSCNLPAECIAPVLDEGAFSLMSFGASTIILVTLLSF